MKTLLCRLSLILFIVVAPIIASACEISIEVLENQKEQYQKGDIIVVKVKVVLIHRHCPEAIESTKFSYEGIKVLGATKWTEVETGTYERKFRLQVDDTTKKKLVFSALRTCEKEGGSGSITFSVG